MAKQVSPLQARTSKDYEKSLRSMDALLAMYYRDMGVYIDQANIDCMAIINAYLSHYSDSLNLSLLLRNRTLDHLRNALVLRYDHLSDRLTHDWEDKMKHIDIMTRLTSSYLSRKATPPWAPGSLNLKDKVSRDGATDPRKGHIHYTFRLMIDFIMKQIQRSAIQEETYHQCLQRVRALFNKKAKKGVRESYGDEPIQDRSEESKLPLGLSIGEGTYTLEDVERFKQDYIRANGQEQRQYRPYYSDEVKANNKYLSGLEQLLTSDAVNLMHEGQLQIGSKEMGIKDFEWVAVGHKTICERCQERDGLTMKEIKKKFKDDTPPRLHPNCLCKLVPKIADDWAQKVAGKDGKSWDSNTGNVYKADKLEKKYGFSDMTFDQYLKNIGER